MIETERLILRSWRDEDLEPFAALNADPEVMQHFPKLLTRDETAEMIARLRDYEARDGFTFWALEVRGGPSFIGMTGLARVRFAAPFVGPMTTEVGWRLARAHWEKGYAVEAARASLAFAFEQLALPEVVAFLVPHNLRSAAVAERLGMKRDPAADFDHPRIAPGALSIAGNPQQRHWLYRLAPKSARSVES